MCWSPSLLGEETALIAERKVETDRVQQLTLKWRGKSRISCGCSRSRAAGSRRTDSRTPLFDAVAKLRSDLRDALKDCSALERDIGAMKRDAFVENSVHHGVHHKVLRLRLGVARLWCAKVRSLHCIRSIPNRGRRTRSLDSSSLCDHIIRVQRRILVQGEDDVARMFRSS